MNDSDQDLKNSVRYWHKLVDTQDPKDPFKQLLESSAALDKALQEAINGFQQQSYLGKKIVKESQELQQRQANLIKNINAYLASRKNGE
jgi:hypothetical protein